jgi:hypothetical protein
MIRMLRIAPTGCVTAMLGAAVFAALLTVVVSPHSAFSLPLYARQTGQPCAACHTAFLELTRSADDSSWAAIRWGRRSAFRHQQ